MINYKLTINLLQASCTSTCFPVLALTTPLKEFPRDLFLSEVVAYITVSIDDPWVKAITTKKPLSLVLLEG